MSSNVLEGVLVPENMVRDFVNTQAGLAANYVFDIQNTGNALGLDIYIRNRGAAALTVSKNGAPAITVDPGDVYIVNDFKMWIVNIVSAVLYDLEIYGVRITTLRRRGLMPKI